LALIENWTSSWTNGSVQGLVIVHEIDGMGFVVVNGKDKALRGAGPGIEEGPLDCIGHMSGRCRSGALAGIVSRTSIAQASVTFTGPDGDAGRTWRTIRTATSRVIWRLRAAGRSATPVPH